MSVICFDIGSYKCITAIIKQNQGLVTIPNDHGQRATPTMVAFNGRNRFVGANAKNQQLTNVKNTAYGFKEFLGKSYDENIEKIRKSEPFLAEKLHNGANGAIMTKVDFMNGEQLLSPEHLLAILFKKLKLDAEADLRQGYQNIDVKECVLTVPIYFTDTERQCVIDASKIAGLKCLGMLSDTTATALNYSYFKQNDFFSKSVVEKGRELVGYGKSYKVCFVDFGHSCLQVNMVEIVRGELITLASEYTLIGGRDINRIICNELIEEIKDKFKVDPKTNEKAYAKLFHEVDELKQKMSVNDQKIHISIDPLMNDKTVRFTYDRERMENNPEFKDLMKQVQSTIEKCLKKAGYQHKVEKIHSVEIVGGSARIPFFKKLIEKVFKKSPSQTLNQDESVARGGAVYCAMLQPTYIEIKEEQKLKLFHTEPIEYVFEFKDGNQHLVPEGDREFVMKPLQAQNLVKCFLERDAIRVSDDFVVGRVIDVQTANPPLNIDYENTGISGFLKARTIEIRYSGPVLQKVPPVKHVPAQQTPSTKFGHSSKPTENKKGKSQELAMAHHNQPERQPEEIRFKFNKMTMIPKPKISNSRHLLQTYEELEDTMILFEMKELHRTDTRNDLEKCMYEVKEKVQMAQQSNAANAMWEELNQFFDDLENWLYEEGDDCVVQIYMCLLCSIQGLQSLFTANLQMVMSPEFVNAVKIQFNDLKEKFELGKSGKFLSESVKELPKTAQKDEQNKIHEKDRTIPIPHQDETVSGDFEMVDTNIDMQSSNTELDTQKNNCEAAIIELRDLCNMKLKNEELKNRVESMLKKSSYWLSDEGVKCNVANCKKLCAMFKNLIDKIKLDFDASSMYKIIGATEGEVYSIIDVV